MIYNPRRKALYYWGFHFTHLIIVGTF